MIKYVNNCEIVKNVEHFFSIFRHDLCHMKKDKSNQINSKNIVCYIYIYDISYIYV